MITRRRFLAIAAGLLALAASPMALAQNAMKGTKGQGGGTRGRKGEGAGTSGSASKQKGPQQSEPSSPLLPLGKTIVLGAPTATSIRMSALLDQSMSTTLRVFDSKGEVLALPPQQLSAGMPKELEVAGLKAGGAYRYVLEGKSSDTMSVPMKMEGRFRTVRLPGQAFRFAVHADPHNRDDGFTPEIYEETIRKTLAGDPDFAIDLGDNLMTEKYGTKESDALDCVRGMRPWYGKLAHSVPLFLMNGNHEAELGWFRREGNPLFAAANRMRKSHYPCPTADGFYLGDAEEEAGVGRPDVYSAWHWGDALFVLLDPFWYTTEKPGRGGIYDGWKWTLGEKQYRWLVKTLRGSEALAKFVFCHHLVGGGDSARGGVEFAHLYEWGGTNADGTAGFAKHRPGWEKPIHALLVECGVTIFFHGHDHFYAMQEKDGVVYQLVPQPSHRNTKSHSALEYGYKSGVFLPNSGHVQVSVAGESARVDYIRSGPGITSANEIAHSYTRALSFRAGSNP